MRRIGQFAGDKAADRFDLLLRDLCRLSAEADESNGTVGTKGVVIAAVVIDIDEKVVFEERLFDHFVPVAPTSPDFVSWKERLDVFVSQFLKDVFFVSRPSVDRIPRCHTFPMLSQFCPGRGSRCAWRCGYRRQLGHGPQPIDSQYWYGQW